MCQASLTSLSLIYHIYHSPNEEEEGVLSFHQKRIACIDSLSLFDFSTYFKFKTNKAPVFCLFKYFQLSTPYRHEHMLVAWSIAVNTDRMIRNAKKFRIRERRNLSHNGGKIQRFFYGDQRIKKKKVLGHQKKCFLFQSPKYTDQSERRICRSTFFSK